MFRIVKIASTSSRQLFTRAFTTSKPLFMALQTTNGPLASLNNAAMQADLNLNGTLEEIAARHFSEASTFPEFSPTEDTLLTETMPRIKTPEPVLDAHTMAVEELTLEMQQHFCEPSDFPEITIAEEEVMLQRHV
ncbi:unnamed protein product [Peronospora belbahrii]|uniref:Uncharacterized protein n=1 Tax=Peronospora belbahrii TaxID=622444 RepID=A0AAU9L617_9STRA|nr:unnamed protein product [Peronospora belbahrii]CAH0522500.1 unnamed protein product [Peronospora belbahrii]